MDVEVLTISPTRNWPGNTANILSRFMVYTRTSLTLRTTKPSRDTVNLIKSIELLQVDCWLAWSKHISAHSSSNFLISWWKSKRSRAAESYPMCLIKNNVRYQWFL